MTSLYPHNQEAYNKANFILSHSDRTCVVHATGTGKSLIATKFITDNKGLKFLFIAPTIFIFKEIKKHIKRSDYNIQFRTYSYFLNKDLSKYTGYDYIIIDEFHRAGADEWGTAIDEILELNPKAKKLGLSATHIRYLDNERNMADELFNGSIASSLNLGTAIEKGIHKVPKYVSALYNVREILEKTEKRLRKYKRNKDADALKAKRVIWEKSSGIDFILKKHLLPKRKKILVFCKSIEHIDYVQKLICPVLSEIYNDNVEFNTIYSTIGERAALRIFEHFEKSNMPQVLFCIDMLNEGIHINNTDTVMMFRDTISPILYFQQMGRAFSVGQNLQPLIFDFVNNFNIKNSILSIQQSFYEDFNQTNTTDFYKKRNLIIDFYDEMLDFQHFIDQFKTFKTWDQSFQEFKDFINQNGRMPTKNEMSWTGVMKQQYKNGKLSKDQIDKIIEIAPDFFDIKKVKTWEESFQEFKDFINQNGRVPTGVELKWVAYQKNRFVNGKLSKDQINKITGVAPDFFDIKKVKTWEESFQEFKDFVNQNGRVPTNAESQWVENQKNYYQQRKLSKDQIDKITGIAPNFFDIKKVKTWEESFQEFKDFINLNGRVPTQSEMSWMGVTKQRYKKGKLSKDQIDKIIEIAPDFFDIKKVKTWEESFQEFKDFINQNGRVPTQREMRWIQNQRIKFKKGKLSQAQIERIETIAPEIFIV